MQCCLCRDKIFIKINIFMYISAGILTKRKSIVFYMCFLKISEAQVVQNMDGSAVH